MTEENSMSIQFGKTRVALFVVAIAAAAAGSLWLWGFAPRAVGNETGVFELVEAADKSVDGAPALALTFTLPLDSRKSYDRFIQVFEMPAAAGATPARDEADPGEFDESPRGARGGVSVVSVKPEDTVTEGGRLISGAWTVGENPRLLFFPNIKPVTRYVVLVSSGLEARSGSKLAADSRYSVLTAPVPPAYFFASNGTVLPAKQNGGLPVVTVNVPEVDIQFLRVKSNRLPDFLDRVIGRAKASRTGRVEETSEEDEYDYRRTPLRGVVGNYQLDELRGMTDSVYLGRFVTERKPNRRSVTYVSVEEIRELAEPGIYVAVMSQPGRFRYDYQTTYFYVSDLGLHVRLFEKSADAFVSSLVDGKAVRGVDLAWLDAKGKTLAQAETDSNGHAAFAEIPKEARVAVARKDRQLSMIALREPALDLSEYDVVGAPYKAVRLFAYTGRNLYRPGEAFDVSVLARDADGRPVPAQPIQAVLKNPLGRRQFTAFWKPDSRFPGNYVKRIELPADAATGFWTLELRADPADTVPGTSFRFGVEEFLPERMKLDLATDQATVTADQMFTISARGAYLYGAPAANNRLLAVAEFERAKNPLAAKYPGFEFGDVRDDSVKSRQELPEQTTDAQGAARIQVALAELNGKQSPITARVVVSLLETGGRPVVRTIERVVWPAPVLTGVRPLFTGDYAREGSRVEFEVLRADRDGNLKGAEAMPVRLFRENRDYYWRFDDQRGWHSGFNETDELVETLSVAVPEGGRGKVLVPVKYGRYRLEILDQETGRLLAYRFYAGWNARSDETQGVRPDRVTLKLDKPGYREGQTAHLTLTAPHRGEALVTVEGDRTLWVKRVSVDSETVMVDIPINPQWKRHDLYVSVMALRPGNAGSLVTPARALGLVHLPIERNERRLNVALDAPQKILPNTLTKVKVRAPEARGQSAVVTLSAVDVGILNITRFESPDPYAFFFGQLRYGADQHDVYGRLIEKMQGQKGQLKFGGDSMPLSAKGLPKIVRLVDIFSGPVALNDQGEAEIPLQIPDFNGTVRLMAVVASPDRFGSKDAEMIVAAPLITELLTPRFLSFGDKAVVALDLQNLSGAADDLKVSVRGAEGLEVRDGERSLRLKDQEKQTLRFPVEAGFAPGAPVITVKVTGQRLNIERTFPVAVQPSTPQQHFSTRYSIKAGETLDIQNANLSGLYRGSALAHMVVSNQPPIDVRAAVRDLLVYPYGCAEQTTSTAYPHLFIDEEEARSLGLKPFTRDQRMEMVEKAVARLTAMQAPVGGFSLWGNPTEYEYWLSAYVTRFLVDAREQGFAVPDAVHDKAVDFLSRGLQSGISRLPVNGAPPAPQPGETAFWAEREAGTFDVLAFGAYVLSKERKAPVATLRQLFELRSQARSGLALTHLGIALQLMGDSVRGRATIEEGLRKGRSGYTGYDYYGTPLRDAALSYALLERHEIVVPGRENLLALISTELENKRYYSTQEKMALFFVGRSLTPGADIWTASVTAGGRTEQLSRKGAHVREVPASQLSSGVRLANTSNQTLYVELALSGNPIANPPAQREPIELGRSYFTPDGKPIGGRPLKVGESVLVRLTVQSRTPIGNGLVVDKIPAGLEIENLNLVRGEQLGGVTIDDVNPAAVMRDGHIKHVEFRDDRFVAAVRIDESYVNRYINRGVLTLFYRARVVTPGEFIVPALYAEDMYRPNIFGLAGGSEKLTIVDVDAR
jgi:uncharacterized protein YfaS (alpha-2-macroglobulin family)